MGTCCSDADNEESKPLNNGSLSTVSGSGSRAATPSGSAHVRLPEYEKVAFLGHGSFAKVSLVRNKLTQKLFAVKKIEKQLVVERGQIETTATERRLLGTLKHPFLVALHESFQNQKYLYLVLSYAAGGDLSSRLGRDVDALRSLSTVFFYGFEVALALHYLHENDFIYRDLKPENVLIEETGHVLLTDFGVSKKTLSGLRATSFSGTLLYTAPEVFEGKDQTPAVDWWSFGCLLFELVNGRHPFRDPLLSEPEIMRNIVERDVELQEGDFVVAEGVHCPNGLAGNAVPVMNELKKLILSLLSRNPTSRPTGQSVLSHPFFLHPYHQQDFPALKNILPDAIQRTFLSRLVPPPAHLVPSLTDTFGLCNFPSARLLQGPGPGFGSPSFDTDDESRWEGAAPTEVYTPTGAREPYYFPDYTYRGATAFGSLKK